MKTSAGVFLFLMKYVCFDKAKSLRYGLVSPAGPMDFLKFREIHSKHTNDIRVYTDGSAPGRFGGYGVVIFDRLRQMPVYEASVEIGEATNNVAELEAIHNALLWILENARAVLTQPAHVRLYTDSELARNFLLARYTAKHHSYLIESIQALGAKLRYDHASPVTLHWIPSHIEHTAWGKLPIYGNCRADKLAEKARNCSSHFYAYRQVSHQRTAKSRLDDPDETREALLHRR